MPSDYIELLSDLRSYINFSLSLEKMDLLKWINRENNFRTY